MHDSAAVEPSDASLAAAVERAKGGPRPDVVVAVGGGSSIDTAKAVSLLLSNPGELMDYVNAPVGGGRAPEQPVLPLVAVPTTTGTGAESTTVCVLDVLASKVETGVSHERLRPVLAVVDPELTATQPAGVTASAGMDILCHALESWTARPYTSYEHKSADQRVPYCGSNPISDLYAEKAMRLLAGAFRGAVAGQEQARVDMALAATFAGMGFGNAGVHVPHANAYPIAGRVHDLGSDFRPRDYDVDEAMVPHGMAVASTAPAAFAMTFAANRSATSPPPPGSTRRALTPTCPSRSASRPCCAASCVTSASPRAWPRSATATRTSTASCRGRCSSSGCSRRPRGRSPRRTSPAWCGRRCTTGEATQGCRRSTCQAPATSSPPSATRVQRKRSCSRLLRPAHASTSSQTIRQPPQKSGRGTS